MPPCAAGRTGVVRRQGSAASRCRHRFPNLYAQRAHSVHSFEWLSWWPVSFVVLAGMWAAMNGSLAALLADGIYIGGGVLVVILIILVVLLLMRRGV